MKDNFECLQCGNCCYKYALHLPGGKRKEPFTPCDYLVEPNFKDKVLSLAECKLHGTEEQPDICGKTFRTRSVLSDLEGECEIGQLVWGRYAARYGIDRIPERVQEILEGIYQQKLVEKESTKVYKCGL